MLCDKGSPSALLVSALYYSTLCEATTGFVSYTNSSVAGLPSASVNSSDSPQPTAYSDPAIESCSSCDSSWGNWQGGWLQWSAAKAPTVWPEQTTSSLSSGISCIGGVTTLCDGVPRCMKAVATTKTIWGMGFNSNEPWNEPDPIPPYPSPTPTCTLSDEQCEDLWGAYDSLSRKYPDLSMTMPYCSEWQGWGSFIDPCDSCYVTANAVQLLYWSVTVKSQGVCSNGTGTTTITATATIPGQPNTATWQNKTIVTSPSVYLSFASLYAYGTKWYPSGLGYGICGSTARNVMVPVKPDAITSYRGPAGWLAEEDPAHSNMPYSFNYADLNYRVLNDSYSIPLVPKDAYTGMEDCYNGVNCTTIYPDGWYKPEIGLSAVEAAFTDVDPKWSKCGFNFGGFYDPPLPLTTASNLDAPTPTMKPTPETTAPAPAQTTQQPTKTAGGDDPGSGSSGPKMPHTESTVPAADPTTQPGQTAGGSSGSDSSNSEGGGDSNHGGNPTNGGEPNNSDGSSNGAGPDNSGGSSSDGGSNDGDSNESGSHNSGSGDPGSGGQNGSAGSSDPSDSGSAGQSGSSENPGGDGGSSDPNGGDSGSSAVITISIGQSITVSQLPTSGGGNHDDGAKPEKTRGAAFTVVDHGTTISVGGTAATVSGIEISAAPDGIAVRPTGSTQSDADGPGPRSGDGDGNDSSRWSTVSLTPVASRGGVQATGAIIFLPGQSSPVTATEVSSGMFVVPATGTTPAITLSRGGSAATVNGVTLSADSSGVVVEGSNGGQRTTVAASLVPENALAQATEVVVPFPGHATPVTASEVAPGVYVLPASGSDPEVTLSAGGPPKTVDGAVLSAGPSGIVVEGSNGHPLTTLAASTVAIATEAIFTPYGHGPMFAIEIGPGIFVLPGTDGSVATTISAGGSAVTVDGTVVSAAGSGLVVGGKIVPASIVAVPTGAESTGIGGYIITGLDGGSSTTSGSEQFTGGTGHIEVNRWRSSMIVVVVASALMLV